MFDHPSFAAFARLCGGHGHRVHDGDDLHEAIADAIAHDGPSLVEIVTDADLV